VLLVGGRLRRVSAAAALSLATLGPVLFLGADEPQSAAMLPNDARPLDALLESPKQLVERFRILDLNPHA
jgi:hypothetical protein